MRGAGNGRSRFRVELERLGTAQDRHRDAAGGKEAHDPPDPDPAPYSDIDPAARSRSPAGTGELPIQVRKASDRPSPWPMA